MIILSDIVGKTFRVIGSSLLGCWKLSDMSCKKAKRKAKTECHCTAERIWITFSRFKHSISPLLYGIRNRVTWPERYNRTDCIFFISFHRAEYRYYTILYTDYNNVKISFRCGEQNFNTNVCDNPVVVVQTRQHPNLLTDDQKQSIDQTIDAVLSPYCISSKQLNSTLYNASLSLCAPEEPTAFVLLIDLLAKYFWVLVGDTLRAVIYPPTLSENKEFSSFY